MKEYEISQEQLYKLYITDNRSREEIADLCSLSNNRIKYLLKLYHIHKPKYLCNRLIAESNKGQVRSSNTRQNISTSLKGRKPWNRGLTKTTDVRVAKYSKSNSGRKRTFEQRENISVNTRKAMAGLPAEVKNKIKQAVISANKNRVYSKKDRDKKSEIARRLWENPEYANKCSNSIYGNKSYYKGIRFMSDIEKKYAQKLDKLGIKYETQPGPFKYLYSKDNKYHNYYPDFYLPKQGIYLEIKYKKNDFSVDTKVQDKLEGMAKLGLKCLLLDKKDLYNLDAVIG